MSLLDRNKAAWNQFAETGSIFARVATDEECRQPLLTLDGRGWLPPSVQGLDVLCLASGGGWQSILYATAGARVTVVDISPSMLRLDREEADRRRLGMRLIEASMDNLSMLDEAAFDIVHQPVSTCYVPDVERVYKEVARVLRDGGLYISQHKQPVSLQVTGRTPRDEYVIGIRHDHQGPLPWHDDDNYRERGTTEFLHSWEKLVGGLCRAGLVLEDLREPIRTDETARPGHYKHRGFYIPPYVRLKARRLPRLATQRGPEIWIPR